MTASAPFRHLRAAALGAGLLAGATLAAHAADAYVATGFPYLVFGVSQPVAESITLRGDWGTVGHHAYTGSTSDNDYAGTLKYDRFGLFADWFASGNFRLTGGLTVNHGSTTMVASSHNNQITIGGQVYNYTGDVTSTITLPNATPYLGLGWGHAASTTQGFAFHADLGASIGKPKATALKAEGQVAQYVSPEALAAEDQKFQSGVNNVKAIPQLTVGVIYRF